MALQTDFNVAPYFDDYNEENNFHKILFKPSYNVGSRELIQMQRILQTQIERFGETVLERGSIISGGNFYDYTDVAYVKIMDNNEQNQPIVIRNYVGAKLIGTNTGVEAVVLTTLDGFESKSPELNTLYVKYIKSGIDANDMNVKTFLAGETLEGYVDGVRTPDLDIRVAPYNIDVNPLGTGYAVSCGDGVLFQKGYFVKFSNQIVVVSRYNSVPHEMCVGFTTDETIINYNGDTSLKDNAIGSKNYKAPGADRVKLTPRLIAISIADVEDNLDFMPIQEYENGLILAKRTGTTFSENMYNNIEKRTFEESGNYTIKGHSLAIEKSPQTEGFAVSVTDGVSYVNGKRVETFAKKYLKIDETVESGVSTDTLSFDYGPYVKVSNMIGTFNTNSIGSVSLMSANQTATGTTTGTIIGTAKVFSFIQSENPRVYLTDIIMNAGQVFENTRAIKNGTTGYANLILESNGKPARYKNNNKKLNIMIPTTGVLASNVNSVAYTKSITATLTSNVINITSGGANSSFDLPDGTYNTSTYLKKFSVTRANTVLNPTSIVISGGSKNAQINLTATNGSVIIAHNSVESAPQRITKTISHVYVRIDPNLIDKTGPLYLGLVDVHSIAGIWMGSNNTFTESSTGVTNVTNQFVLTKNIDGMSYGTSFIKKRSTFNLTNANKLLVRLRVFSKSAGLYSTISSYPIDDVTTPLPTSLIRSSSLEYDRRNGVDFRYYYTNTSTLAATPAAATIINSGNNVKSSTISSVGGTSIGYVPQDESQFDVTYTHNLPRMDNVIIDSKGNLKILNGVPSPNPKVPSIGDARNMSLGTIYVPAPPRMLLPDAVKLGNPDNGIIVQQTRNKSYTMTAIGNIDERVSNIEYYTVLSAQELSADNMVIKGADGLDRFKNGIFVENFKNMAACDVRNEDFGASVDSNILYPRFKSYNLGLEVKSNSANIVLDTNTANLKYNEVIHEQQIISTKYRNCVTDFYNFNGDGVLFPEYDFGYDETIAPDVNININLEEAFADYSAALNEFIPLQTSVSNSTSVTTSLGSNTVVSGRTTTVTNNFSTTTTTTTSTSELVQSGSTIETQRVGDFVTNIQFSPFMRANKLNVAFSGMRPNTRFWVWFDGVNVSENCAPGTFSGDTMDTVKKSGAWGAPLRSDSIGELVFIFDLPKDTFYVGERTLIVMDVDSMIGADSATSSAAVKYNAFNYSVEKGGLEISTRTPTFEVEKTVSVESVTNTFSTTTTTTRPSVSGGGGSGNNSRGDSSGRSGNGRGDPISQTFVIDKSISDKEAIMVTKISIPFKSKSTSLGVTLSIRNVVNGYPSDVILPFSSKRLSHTMVKVSDDGSVYTDFVFASPVSLTVGESYAFVIMPDSNSPDYRVFTNKTGEVDLLTGKSVTSDTSSGTLFTSTNNEAWTPYQDENMSYKIYRAEYTAKTGDVFLGLQNYEFFDIEGMTGLFKRGETVFKINPFNQGTVSTGLNSRTIVSNGVNLKNIFKVGDHIAIYNELNDTYAVSRINTIVDDTSMTLDEYMDVAQTNRRFFKTVVGVCDYIDKTKNPVRLFVKNSSASTTNFFATGNALRGETSNASASVSELLSLPISAWQANIYRNNYIGTRVGMVLDRQTTATGSILNPNTVQKFGETNRLLNENTVVKSRSLELTQNGGSTSFSIKLTLNIDGNAPYTVSPSIDFKISGVTLLEYLIEPSTFDLLETEKFDGGESLSKYISKNITLRDGFDAEDLKLWITAYKPLNTEITVFAKFISNIDETPVNEIPWTKMAASDVSNFRSSSTNIEDYKEFEFSLPTVNPGPNGGAYVTTGDGFRYIDANGGIHENYKVYKIKIVLNSSGQNRIPKIKDVRAISLT